MPQGVYQHLLLERLQSQYYWDALPATQASLHDLDTQAILRTVRAGIQTRRLPLSIEHSDIQDILHKLNFIQNGQLVNAAIVLYGTQFLPYYPQCVVRLARFKGTTKAGFIDNQQYLGHAFNLLDEAMTFIGKHLPVAGSVQTHQLQRVDKPLYPNAAIREALVNAVCHRDYSIYGGAVNVAIFDDRLEMWSDGRLPFGQTVEQLKGSHSSKPRNPLIANIFYKQGLLENWGRGTQDMIEACLREGYPEPTLEEVGISFRVCFWAKPVATTVPLDERHEQILTLLKTAKSLSSQAIHEQLNPALSRATVKRLLKQLKDKGLIESQGAGPSTKWLIKHEPI